MKGDYITYHKQVVPEKDIRKILKIASFILKEYMPNITPSKIVSKSHERYLAYAKRIIVTILNEKYPYSNHGDLAKIVGISRSSVTTFLNKYHARSMKYQDYAISYTKIRLAFFNKSKLYDSNPDLFVYKKERKTADLILKLCYGTPDPDVVKLKINDIINSQINDYQKSLKIIRLSKYQQKEIRFDLLPFGVLENVMRSIHIHPKKFLITDKCFKSLIDPTE